MGCFWQCLTYTGVQTHTHTHNVHINVWDEDLAEGDLLSTQDRIYSLTLPLPLLLPAFLPIYYLKSFLFVTTDITQW